MIFSAGQEPGELRCQVDIETDGCFVAFAVGFGQFAVDAFNDALERMQWSEKNEPSRMII